MTQHTFYTYQYADTGELLTLDRGGYKYSICFMGATVFFADYPVANMFKQTADKLYPSATVEIRELTEIEGVTYHDHE